VAGRALHGAQGLVGQQQGHEPADVLVDEQDVFRDLRGTPAALGGRLQPVVLAAPDTFLEAAEGLVEFGEHFGLRLSERDEDPRPLGGL